MVNFFPFLSTFYTPIYTPSLDKQIPLCYTILKGVNSMRKKLRAKGTGSIYKNEKGYWTGQLIIGITPNGQNKYKRFMGKTQAIVVEKMKAYELANPIKVTEIVEDAALDEYMKYYLTSIKKNSIKPSSYDRDYKTYENQIKPRIGHYLVKDLTSDIIQSELISDLVISGYSHSTIHKSFVLLNETMKHAMLQDMIVKNPCVAVKLPKKENIVHKDIRFFTDAEIEIFKTQAASTYSTGRPRYKYGNALCLILYTGLRGGELCSLRWGDIDYKKKQVRVDSNTIVVYDYNDEEKTKTRKVIEQASTKNSKIRIVPLNQKALDVLTKQKKLVGGSDNDYIVNGNSTIIDVGKITDCYESICKTAGIKNALGVHTLRHTFASRAIRKGIDIKVVSEILGHSSVTFTYNTYVHIIDEQKKNAVDLLDDL